VWMTVGSDNLNLRSWTHDSELSCAVIGAERDLRTPRDPAGLGDGARVLPRATRLRLACEHLGRDQDDHRGLIDPSEAFDTFEADETHATFSLQQQDGGGVLDVQLVSSCDATGPGVAVEGFPTVQRYRSEVNGGSGVVWISTFPGGCSRAELTFPAPPAQADVDRMERAISFFPRDQLRPM